MMNENDEIKLSAMQDYIPIIPLKDLVIFPNMVVPLFVGRKVSISALENSLENTDNHKMVLLLGQKEHNIDNVDISDLYTVGTYSKVLQVLKLPDGTNKVLIEGIYRAKVSKCIQHNDYFVATIAQLDTKLDISDLECEAIRRELVNDFIKFAESQHGIRDDVISLIAKIDDVEQLIDVITTHVITDLHTKQYLLEETSLKKRLRKLSQEFKKELDIIGIEKKIQGRVKKQIEKNHKEYYLHEQARAIQHELGEDDDASQLNLLEKSIKNAKLSDEARAKLMSEFKRLKIMPTMSSEGAIVRNYIDYVLKLPWAKTSRVNKNLSRAGKQLNKDHYGLDKVKDRVLEYLAVQNRVPVEKSRALILCFVGAPGVGKTSLVESIAKSTGRKYGRIALGGMHDEAEITGHRKTYIGAMAGKLIQRISKSGVNNAVILLDEIDKIGRDHRGDPAFALLEALDPEQNKTFVDNYVEVPFDLSKIFFIATANSLDIPAPLLDRMEVIHLSGYTELEKMNIAKRHLIPRQLKGNGLKSSEVSFSDDVILHIIRYYTAESGVRELDRQINKLFRKIVKFLDFDNTKNKKKVIISKDNLCDYLGVIKHEFGIARDYDTIGRVNGLAWNGVGGDLLTIEVVSIMGTGKIIYTGKLGDVMKESIQTALSVVRKNANILGISSTNFDKLDIHVHVPEAATPKDGPSAGIAIVTAISSSLNNIAVHHDIAMTGEVTLYGEVLPIGGLKEKLLAALRGCIKRVLIPCKNIKDLEEIPDEIKGKLNIIPVENIHEVLQNALVQKPKLFIDNSSSNKTTRRKTKTAIELKSDMLI